MWHDVKVFKDHVFIVSEAYDHGMQVYDLRQLRNLKASKPGDIVELGDSAHYGEFGSAHNIVANEDTGFMYSVGSCTCDKAPTHTFIALYGLLRISPNPTLLDCSTLKQKPLTTTCI